MRTTFLIFLFITSLVAKGQNWQTQKFAESNFNFEIQFPATPTIEKNITATDSVIKMTATLNSVTYFLVATKTKTADGAITACNNAVSSTASKAKTVELNAPSTIASIKTTQLKYISQKNVYVNSQWFSLSNVVYQVMTLKLNAYGDAGLTETFFNSFKINTGSTKVPISVNTTTNTSTTNTTANTTNSSTGKYAVNDRVEVYDASQSKWFGAIILKANTDGTYLVAYDGYGDTYDETVDISKIQGPTTATTTDKVPYVKAVKGQTISFTGNLSTGAIIEDLEWAESSSMACWPGIRNVEFEGNHVGYWFDLPKKSIVKITVTPKSSKTRINIYGYSGFDFKKLPPEVSRCTTCEASHPTWIGQPDLTEPAQPQTIEFNATTRHNFVYFAVAGARGVTSGEYTVTIELI